MMGRKETSKTRWPDFFIVGTRRAGTTSLYYHLRAHPDIFMPSPKEPQFFVDIDLIYAIRAARKLAKPVGVVSSEQDYLALFSDAGLAQVTGEASASYLSTEMAPNRIREKNSHAKIIAILREPVDWAYSAYLLNVREGREPDTSFYKALQIDYEYLKKHSNEWSRYIWPALYYQHIKRYLDAFGREQVRIYLYEDLVSDTAGVVRDICSFLGVSFYDGSFFDPDERYYTYGAPRNDLFRWLGRSRAIRLAAAAVAPMHLLIPLRDRLVNRQAPKPPLDPEAQEFLRPIFSDEILKLQELIERDLSGWLA